MKGAGITVLLCIALASPTVGQPSPGDLLGPIDDVLGQTIPPTVGTIFKATGQNLTREDLRLFVDLNFTAGGIGVLGLVLGSGKAQIEATIGVRGELRVISTERIRAAIEGDNAYDIEARNATWMSELYIPAEAFRASLTAEVAAAFQAEQEAALVDLVQRTVPEMEIISLEIDWKNTHPYRALGDLSLTEPPIVVELDAKVRYQRVESIPSLLSLYFDGRKPSDDPKKQYIQELKEENGDPLKSRDFFAAAAYTQLLNVSMQPGWLLEVRAHVPRGYEFTYANENIDLASERDVAFRVDAMSSEDDVQEVLLLSMTHPRAVVLSLFVLALLVGTLVGLPLRYAYLQWRLPRLGGKATTDS